jgi:all-trans-retinol 13,14-reductase
MQDFDTIIIGSGAGGLSAALCLGRAGQKVLVLEQHYVPGGWCHSFYLNGYRFSPGVHYIGAMDKGESTSQLYEGLGIANDLVFFRMNKNAYEHCRIGNETIDMPADINLLYESLAQRFPAERKRLKTYLDLVKTVADEVQLIPKMKSFWDHVTIPYRTRHMGKYGLFKLKTVIDWHIKDPLLKAVLNVQCGDHGLPPSIASFPVHCVVMNHYFNGGFYPMGGGGAIVKAMTNAIHKYGGEIRTKQRVKKILLSGNKKFKAIGVEMESGEIIKAKRILSNADPTRTFELIGKENQSKKLQNKLAKTRYSITSLFLFLTVDMDVRKAGMDSGNIWKLQHEDLEKIYAGLTVEDVSAGDEFPACFISCPTLKDPLSFNGRYHTIEVVTFLEYKSFAGFKKPGGYCTEEYLKYKERITEKLLNSVEKILPGVRNKIIQMELGTPMTSEYYINSTDGNAYGTEKSFRQTGPFSFGNESEIEDLYLCGASIFAHGVSGATNSGVLAAAKILGCRPEELIKPVEGQEVRVYDAEDSSQWPDWIHQRIADRKKRFKEITNHSREQTFIKTHSR